jgi:hypothetical protein
MLQHAVNKAALAHIQKNAVAQSAVLVEAGAFDADIDQGQLPPELSSASGVLELARRTSRAVFLRTIFVFGGTFAALGGGWLYRETGSLVGAAIAVVVALLGGLGFAALTSTFLRYVVLPIGADQAELWSQAVVGIGYSTAGADDRVRSFKPGVKNGKASGKIFIVQPEPGRAYLLGPATHVAVTVRRRAATSSR